MTAAGDQNVPPVLVVFEGLDGSGKSTCARLVADLLGAVFLTTPSPEVRVYRDDLIARFAECQEACQLFYLATVFAASEAARAFLADGHSVVIDRYFLSTQAYAAFRGSRLCVDDVERLLTPAHLTVFLDSPLQVRRRRLEGRGVSAADRETLSPGADARIRAEHLKRVHLGVVGRFVTLDSSDATPEALAARVVAELRSIRQPAPPPPRHKPSPQRKASR